MDLSHNADAVLKGLSKNTNEIRVGMVKFLYVASHISPDFINKKINQQVENARIVIS